jgi:hypothetical protein
MSTVVHKVLQSSAVAAGFLWPLVVTLELADGINYFPSTLALAAAYFVGGRRMFWDADFRDFIRGYMAGGVVTGLSTYSQIKLYEPAIDRGVAAGETLYSQGKKYYAEGEAFQACYQANVANKGQLGAILHCM